MTETRFQPPRLAHDAPISWGLVVAATLLAVGTVALIWLAAVPWGPLVCPAIHPAPRNCFAADRAGTGLVTTIIVMATLLATILLAVLGRGRTRELTIAGVILLALAPVVSYLTVAWVPGFALASV